MRENSFLRGDICAACLWNDTGDGEVLIEFHRAFSPSLLKTRKSPRASPKALARQGDFSGFLTVLSY